VPGLVVTLLALLIFLCSAAFGATRGGIGADPTLHMNRDAENSGLLGAKRWVRPVRDRMTIDVRSRLLPQAGRDRR
jgi:hypothetical protein